jgi:hypothetical protein
VKGREQLLRGGLVRVVPGTGDLDGAGVGNLTGDGLVVVRWDGLVGRAPSDQHGDIRE